MTEPRRVSTMSRGTPQGGNVSFGMRHTTAWEDPETGSRYPSRVDAQAAIARRQGLPFHRVSSTAVGDYVVTDLDGRQVGPRHETRRSANQAARELNR